jgi:hypothetical protein
MLRPPWERDLLLRFVVARPTWDDGFGMAARGKTSGTPTVPECFECTVRYTPKG